MNNSYRENYIQHHGIRGQKWGKQNGPPYPLDAGSHSASEKKAGWKKSLNNNSDDNKNKTTKTTATSLEDMSDNELQSVIKRLELEKRYKEITSSPDLIKKTKNIFAINAVKKGLGIVLTSGTVLAASTFINKLLGRDILPQGIKGAKPFGKEKNIYVNKLT